MPSTINALKARQNFGELLNKVFYGKETIIIERAGKEMAVILPVAEYKTVKQKREQDSQTAKKLLAKVAELQDELNEFIKDTTE